MSTESHKANAPSRVTVAILTVSTTRTLSEDKSGHWMSKRIRKEGHKEAFHQIVPDVAQEIRAAVLNGIAAASPDALLVTGGTGIALSDVTIETIRPLFRKEMTAFGALFAQLSFEEIDSAAMLSRATAGIIDNTAVFCLPGSLKACKLACKSLILPELAHLTQHLVAG